MYGIKKWWYDAHRHAVHTTHVIRNFAPPKFRKVKPPTKNTINKECKCGKNREAFINFVVETKK